MAKNVEHVSHIKSKLKTNGLPQLPTADKLVDGEIAINYAEGVETISIRNENSAITTFSSDNYYTEKKLGSGFTNNDATVTEAIDGLEYMVVNKEEAIAAALNDLNGRKLDASAYTPTDLSNYYTKSETSGATEIYDLVGSGFTSSSITDVIIENEEITSNALNELSSRKLDASAYTPTDLSNYLPLSGGTITGNLIIGGSDIPEVAGNLTNYASTHSVKFYRNGFLIPYQMNDTNDGGFFRVRGTGEDSTVCEIGTWDDFGEGETIQFNYYPTTSTINPTYSVSVPKATGTLALTSQIPTNTNQLTNGAGFITSNGSCNYATTAGSAPASDVYAWAKAASKPSYTWDEISSKPSTFTPSAHNQASNTINSMAGYSKPSTTSAIATSDTLNSAIGKLEKNEEIISSALNGLEERKLDSSAYTPVHYSKVNVTGNLTNITCPVTLSTNGEQCNVLYVNDSTEHTVTISTNYKSPDNSQINLTIKANGYAEVNYLYFDGVIYVRGV